MAAGLLAAPTAAGCQHSPGFCRQLALLLSGLKTPTPVVSRSQYGTAAAALKEPGSVRVMGQWPDKASTSLPTHQSELPSSIKTRAEIPQTFVAPQPSPSAALLGPRSQNVAAEHIFLLRCGQDEFVAHNPFPTSSGHLLKLYRRMHRHPPRWDDGVQGWVFPMAAHDELMRVLLKAPSSQHIHVHPLPEVAAMHPDVMSAEAAAEGAEDLLADTEARAEADTPRAARRAKRLARQAAQALQRDAPTLASQLEREGLMDLVRLLPYGHGDAYWRMHQVLENVWHQSVGKGGVAGWAEATASPREGFTAQHPYSLSYLRCLIKQAQQAQTAESRVQWGWVGRLASFVFVFPEANRLVVERPQVLPQVLVLLPCSSWFAAMVASKAQSCTALQYANATYLFCLEEPLPIRDQIHRLVAVLSAKGITRACLRQGSPLVLDQGLTQEQRALLASLGWSQSMAARQLLNFAGERIIHSQQGERGVADFQRRLDELLSKGAAEGRIHKPIAIAG
eukprot:jgi/Astpho2/1968/Aster-00477